MLGCYLPLLIGEFVPENEEDWLNVFGFSTSWIISLLLQQKLWLTWIISQNCFFWSSHAFIQTVLSHPRSITAFISYPDLIPRYGCFWCMHCEAKNRNFNRQQMQHLACCYLLDDNFFFWVVPLPLGKETLITLFQVSIITSPLRDKLNMPGHGSTTKVKSSFSFIWADQVLTFIQYSIIY